MTGPALRTDHYELTMLDAALRTGIAHHRAVFEVFARRLPAGRGYGVVAGTGRLAHILDELRFGDDDLAALSASGAFSGQLIEFLAGHVFEGDVRGHREGEVFMPDTPVLVVETSFGAGLLLETIVLSVLNHDAAIAAVAARVHEVAEGRTLIEMGSRRTHEDAAVDAARAAWLAGFDTTSNLAAGAEYGIPTAGTSSHAFTMAHPSEEVAFDSQVAALGPGTTLLVDTYDIPTGIERALAAAERVGGRLGAVRIDSGDLAEEAHRARDLLDRAGATDTRIILSGDLDEYRVADLSGTPADAFGVGTSIVTGSGHPTASFVYKLVAVARHAADGAPLDAVGKTSEGKQSRPGRVWPHRRIVDGVAVADVLTSRPETPDGCRPLHVPLLERGHNVYATDLAADRSHHLRARAELPAKGRRLDAPSPALPLDIV